MQTEIKVTGRVLTLSKSTLARNPDLSGGSSAAATQSVDIADPSGHSDRPARQSRIRQSSKPLMNQLESEWFALLKSSGWMNNLRPQAKRYKLGNGIWYKPDVTGNDSRDGRETAYEVKGPHAFRGGFENLKVAAGIWPEVRWILVWKVGEEWRQQDVLP